MTWRVISLRLPALARWPQAGRHLPVQLRRLTVQFALALAPSKTVRLLTDTLVLPTTPLSPLTTPTLHQPRMKLRRRNPPSTLVKTLPLTVSKANTLTSSAPRTPQALLASYVT